MTACIGLYNLMVEDEQGLVRHAMDHDGATDNPALMVTSIDFSQFLKRYSAIYDASTHFQPQHDLVGHLWQHKDNEN
ncbi:hypothetical protein PR003_g5880 [Phytophthora rubi]|nr:hypothetical protein PR003_g5880 [Phytophthora rubi]